MHRTLKKEPETGNYHVQAHNNGDAGCEIIAVELDLCVNAGFGPCTLQSAARAAKIGLTEETPLGTASQLIERMLRRAENSPETALFMEAFAIELGLKPQYMAARGDVAQHKKNADGTAAGPTGQGRG